MVDSIGKKLSQARLKRGLTIEEAAHATKLRPQKIVALENDDYSSFPSNAYAKGFLQIYGRYLSVDVSDFLPSLENSTRISVDDYQYLSNAPAPKPVETIRRERRPPSLAPLIFFLLLVGAGLTAMWVYVNYPRTLPNRKSDTEETAGKERSGETSGTAAATPPEVSTPPPDVREPATPQPRRVEAASTPAPATASPSAVPRSPEPLVPSAAGVIAAAHAPAPAPLLPGVYPATPAPLSGAQIPPDARGRVSPPATPSPIPGTPISPTGLSDRDFVKPTLVPTPDPAAVSSPRSGLNEVLVASVKKTWVTIRRDDPQAAPIFEDYLYPNANPLKLKGARFFIDAREPSAVQITKNGLPFSYQAPNIPVQ